MSQSAIINYGIYSSKSISSPSRLKQNWPDPIQFHLCSSLFTIYPQLLEDYLDPAVPSYNLSKESALPKGHHSYSLVAYIVFTEIYTASSVPYTTETRLGKNTLVHPAGFPIHTEQISAQTTASVPSYLPILCPYLCPST